MAPTAAPASFKTPCLGNVTIFTAFSVSPSASLKAPVKSLSANHSVVPSTVVLLKSAATGGWCSVTVTARFAVAESKPPPDAVCVSVTASSSVSSSAPALTVTVCGSLQSEVVNVRLVLSSVRSVPAWPEIVTVTAADGRCDRETRYSLLPPSRTARLSGFSTTEVASLSITVTTWIWPDSFHSNLTTSSTASASSTAEYVMGFLTHQSSVVHMMDIGRTETSLSAGPRRLKDLVRVVGPAS